MHSEALAAGQEVGRGAERVREDEDAWLGPPERDFLPEAAPVDRNELEGRDPRGRRDVMWNVETRG
jgi:hypothetical protein